MSTILKGSLTDHIKVLPLSAIQTTTTTKEYLTDTFANLIQGGKNSMAFCWRNYINPAFHSLTDPYSLRGRTKYVQKLAAEGKAENIMTMQAYELGFFPSFTRKIHIVTDPTCIRMGLGNIEIKESLFPYPSDLDKLLGKDNMLLCPYAQHRRLRAPVEKSFAKKEIAKYTPELVKVIVKNLFYSDLLENHPSRMKHSTKTIESLSCARSISTSSIAHVLNVPVNHDFTLPLGNENSSQTAQSLLAAQENNVKNKNLISQAESISTFNLLHQAGTETTFRSLSFMFEQMSHHPEAIKNIKEEWELFQGSYPCKGLEDLHEKLTLFALGGEIKGEEKEWPFSPWLNACVKEILRLYPAVTEVRRMAEKKCSLKDTLIEAGDIIIYDIFGAHRNGKVWEAPNEFHPERFLNETRSVWQSHEPLLNFSTGSKKCLGQELAKLELLLSGALYAIFSTEQPGSKENSVTATGSQSLPHSFSDIGFLEIEFPDPTGKMLCGLGLLKKFPFKELIDFSMMSEEEEMHATSIYKNWDALIAQNISPEDIYRFFMEISFEDACKINHLIEMKFSFTDIMSLKTLDREFLIKYYLEYVSLIECEALPTLMSYGPKDREFLVKNYLLLNGLVKQGLPLHKLMGCSTEEQRERILLLLCLNKY